MEKNDLKKIKPYKGKYVSRKKAKEVNDMLALATRPDRTALEKEAQEFIEIIRKRRASNVKVKARLDSNLIASIIDLPASLVGKEVDITITESKPSIVDEFYGIASNIKMSLDDIRDERLDKQ